MVGPFVLGGGLLGKFGQGPDETTQRRPLPPALRMGGLPR